MQKSALPFCKTLTTNEKISCKHQNSYISDVLKIPMNLNYLWWKASNKEGPPRSDRDIYWQYSTLFDIFDNIRQYSTIFNNIRHYSTIFYIIWQYSTLFGNIRHYATIFGIIRHFSTIFDIFWKFDNIRHFSTIFDITVMLRISATLE